MTTANQGETATPTPDRPTPGAVAGPSFELGDLRRAFSRFREDQMTDHAAALTYYGLLSLFPALLFGVAMLGFFGQAGLVEDVAGYLAENGAERTTVESVRSSLESAIAARDTAGVALVIGLASALYGASGAFGAAGRALNVVFRVQEGRGFLRHKLADVGSTLVVLVLALSTIVLVFLGGGLASDVFGWLGLGETAASVFRLARWPAALVLATAVYAWVYYAAPNVEVPRLRLITPGAVAGVVIWILASAGFFLYVANFGSYNKTYGAFAGVVILLLWLWLTNVALLFGAELNAAVDRRRLVGVDTDHDGPTLREKVAPDPEQ